MAPLFGGVADGFGPRGALVSIAALAAMASSMGWRAARAGTAEQGPIPVGAGEDRVLIDGAASPAWAPED